MVVLSLRDSHWNILQKALGDIIIDAALGNGLMKSMPTDFIQIFLSRTKKNQR